MTLESIIIWLIVGALAGILADLVVRGIGLSLLESIVVGIIGAFLGGWLFSALGIAVGGGILGTIFTAFVGAAIILLLLVAFRRGARRR
ncbi:MAG: GlsB/YeaQ/YmgE family stress response membrane protein [Chloroflexi bacterium]|nr:MAG: GlsB/YeaQ/YmgE family stress response membrane protein [Chloroflexota bacterium]